MTKGDMCTAATSTAPFFLTLILCSTMLVTEGLPLYRREHGAEDLIAGEAFLSMLMGSRTQRFRYREPATTEEEQYITEAQTLQPEMPVHSSTQKVLPRTFPEEPSDSLNVNQVNSNLGFSEQSSDTTSANSKERRVVSVRVTSSSEDSQPNNELSDSSEVQKETDLAVSTTDEATTYEPAVAAEIHPSIVAEANKSEFSIDEGEPITRQYEPIPSPQPFSFDNYNPDKSKPYQGSIIYHSNPRETNRARSVSYSSVIQSIPEQKPWNSQRKNSTNEETKLAPSSNSGAETKDYYVTSKYNPADYNESIDKRNYESSSRMHYETTERNWGVPERNYGMAPTPPKPYTPIVYGQPEQNYEVDEAISVESNGRAHGVQPSRQDDPKTKKDDNQKVGYVVEGRNYRKYRVEERTSDGFIVGEYGVVSHDDGSLRGVRYTADGTISPRLIYDALMKFLAL